jgi:hypothetical protein
MTSKFRIRFGAPGIVAVIALVFALAGGAYAASNALSGKQKKEVEKIAKKYAGKPGAAGAAGPAGPVGAKGDTGAAGSSGATGATGKGTTGATGATGQTGFTETLPSGMTETGTWSYGPIPAGVTSGKISVSLPIPLESGEELAFSYVGLVENPITEEFELGPPTADCPGSAEAPEAEPGKLCVYASIGTGANTSVGSIDPISGEGGKAGAVGSVVTFFGVAAGSQGRGDWAATAP